MPILETSRNPQQQPGQSQENLAQENLAGADRDAIQRGLAMQRGLRPVAIGTGERDEFAGEIARDAIGQARAKIDAQISKSAERGVRASQTVGEVSESARDAAMNLAYQEGVQSVGGRMEINAEVQRQITGLLAERSAETQRPSTAPQMRIKQGNTQQQAAGIEIPLDQEQSIAQATPQGLKQALGNAQQIPQGIKQAIGISQQIPQALRNAELDSMQEPVKSPVVERQALTIAPGPKLDRLMDAARETLAMQPIGERAADIRQMLIEMRKEYEGREKISA